MALVQGSANGCDYQFERAANWLVNEPGKFELLGRHGASDDEGVPLLLMVGLGNHIDSEILLGIIADDGLVSEYLDYGLYPSIHPVSPWLRRARREYIQYIAGYKRGIGLDAMQIGGVLSELPARNFLDYHSSKWLDTWSLLNILDYKARRARALVGYGEVLGQVAYTCIAEKFGYPNCNRPPLNVSVYLVVPEEQQNSTPMWQRCRKVLFSNWGDTDSIRLYKPKELLKFNTGMRLL